MLAKKTSKNQITLPKAIVEVFPDAQYFDVFVQDRKIILLPVKIMPAESTLEKIRGKMRRLGITEEDVGEAVRWARRQNK
jgi:hypothetical protein